MARSGKMSPSMDFPMTPSTDANPNKEETRDPLRYASSSCPLFRARPLSLTEADSFALLPRITSRKWHAIKGDIEEALASYTSCLQSGGKSSLALHKTADSLNECGDKMPTCTENGGSLSSIRSSAISQHLGSRIPIFTPVGPKLHSLWERNGPTAQTLESPPQNEMQCRPQTQFQRIGRVGIFP